MARDAVAMMLSSGSLTLQAHEFVAGVGHREIDSREVFAWIQIRDHIKVGCRRTMARPATSRSVFFSPLPESVPPSKVAVSVALCAGSDQKSLCVKLLSGAS